MVGLCILLVVAAGVLPLSILSLRITENHGHLMARATEYAQDKLEQLMALSYGDTISDTRVFPATDTGGSGLTPGGSANAATPVHLYVDYLNMEGALLAAPSGTQPEGWYYQRVWRVEEVGTADPTPNCPAAASAARICLKRITVTATVRTAAQGGSGIVPRATVTVLKAYPF
jgi:hypothetical protein